MLLWVVHKKVMYHKFKHSTIARQTLKRIFTVYGGFNKSKSEILYFYDKNVCICAFYLNTQMLFTNKM